MVGKWRQATISDIADLTGGFAFKSDDYTPDGRFILRTLNIKDDCSISRDDAVYISEMQCAQYARFELQPHDTLFVMVGATLGKVGYVREANLPALLNQNMWRVRAKSDETDPRFLHYAFREAAKSNLGWASGSARDFVRRDDYRNIELPVPSLVEQRAIARILGTLDDKIESNQRMNETLEAMARALFQSWFVDFDPVRAKAGGHNTDLSLRIKDLFPSGFHSSAMGNIPAGWRTTVWGTLVSLEYGKSLGAYSGDESLYPVFGTNGKIGSFTEPLCKHAGIIVGRKGAYRGIHFCNMPFFVIDTAFFVEPRVPIELRWAYYELLRNDINSMDSGSAIPSTSREDFYSLPVVAPPLETQRAFVRILEPYWLQQESNDKQSQNLAALRDTLLPKLISGELRIKTAEKIVEAVA